MLSKAEDINQSWKGYITRGICPVILIVISCDHIITILINVIKKDMVVGEVTTDKNCLITNLSKLNSEFLAKFQTFVILSKPN